MIRLRSVLFEICLVGVTLACGIAFLPLLLGPRLWLVRAGRLWCRMLLACLAATVGLRHRVIGAENLPREPVLVAAKHQSAWDTLVAALVLDDPAIVIKRELLFVPFLGWSLAKVGMIPVDRRAGARALRRMVAAARRAAASGRPILVFPEGTRTAPGAERPYHPGVAALYKELGLPVVPVALNSGLFWARRSLLKRPGTITVSFLPPIPPGLKRKAFMNRLHAAIEGESARLIEWSDDRPAASSGEKTFGRV